MGANEDFDKKNSRISNGIDKIYTKKVMPKNPIQKSLIFSLLFLYSFSNFMFLFIN
jgi:hypothetical protein